MPFRFARIDLVDMVSTNAKKSLITLTVAALAGSLLSACSSNSSAPQPAFWNPDETKVHAKLSANQEAETIATARNLAQLLTATGVAADDAQQLSNIRAASIETPTSPLDSMTLGEIQAKCDRRQITTTDQGGGTRTVSIRFDDKEGHVCPVIFTAVERVQAGSVGQSRGTVGTRELTVQFAAKEHTRVYDEGKIRRMQLTHTESAYVLDSPRRPEAVDHDKYTKTTKGSLELDNGNSVPFLIEHRRSIVKTMIDDSIDAREGQELQTIMIHMPFGAYEMTRDTQYTKNSQLPATRVIVNGLDIGKD